VIGRSIGGDMNGGFVVQEEGASLVREKFHNVRRDRARRLVREVTRSEKPGPNGLGDKTSDNAVASLGHPDLTAASEKE
jgi:hypothetical protein